MATAIFYASSTGATADVAKVVSEQLGDIEVIDIADDGVTRIAEFENIIIGNSTWGEGELQDDWEELWSEFCEIDFSGKTVALFGLGDQDGYPTEYLDAMGIIYEQVISKGANVIGNWEVSDEYFHEESKAIVDGAFVGLAIDEDNQDELTQNRVDTWCQDIKSKIL